MANEVSSPLPDLDWPDQAVISVDLGDPSAVITKFVIHLSQDVPEELIPVESFKPLFTYGAAQ